MEKCRCPEIRSLYIQQLAYAWAEDSTEATGTSVQKKMDTFIKGDLEHARDMIPLLWKIVTGDGNVKPPSRTSPAVSLLRI